MQIVEILEVGPGWNKVRLGDGNVYTLDGNYSWRSNNPGNIEYGDFARSMGAIGEGAVPPGRKRGFAIFPTLEDGQHAREVLQFETPGYTNADTNERWGHSYPDGSIGAAIYRYAPPTENDTEGYIRAVTAAAGVPPETMMRDLTPEQRGAFMEAQQHHEGWRQGEVFNEAGVRLPPAEVPNVVGTQTDTKRGSIADRTNAALDSLAPVPAPRAQGTAARVNAAFDQPRPATMSPEIQAERAARSAPPTPAPREQADAARAKAATALQAAPGLGSGNQPQRLLPVIGPTGMPSEVDPIGQMPAHADVVGLGRRAPTPPVPSGGLVERGARPTARPDVPSGGLVERTAPPAPRGVTRTPGIAGTVQMDPGARPAVADQLIAQAEGARPVPSGGLVGQEAVKPRTGTPSIATAASAADVPKYVVTEKKVPLGDTVKHTSRDSVAAAAAGRKMAESDAVRTIRSVSLNPEWVEQQRQAAPGLGTPAGGTADSPGLGQGATAAPQLVYGTSTGRAYEVGKEYSNGNGSAIAQADGTFKRSTASAREEPQAPVRRSSKEEPTLLERIRTSIGLPSEGLAPTVQRALGITGRKSGSGNSPTSTKGSATPRKSTGSSKPSNVSPGGQIYDRTTGTWADP